MALYATSPAPSSEKTLIDAEERFAEWVYRSKCTPDVCKIRTIAGEGIHDACTCCPDELNDSSDPVLDGMRIVQSWFKALGDEPSLIRALVVHG